MFHFNKEVNISVVVIILIVFSTILQSKYEIMAFEVKTHRFTNFGVQQKILKEIFNSTYNSGIAPFDPRGGASETTITTVNMYIRSIEAVDDIKQEFNVQITFRMKWKDERLAYSHGQGERHNFPYISLSGGRTWVPDIFFTNERKAHLHDITYPNVYTRLYPDGQILHSLRVTLCLKCAMNFKLYPFDSQNCSIRLASYGSTVNYLLLLWQPKDPVQVTKDIDLPVFHLKNYSTSYCNSETETGVYSCLNAAFLFKRKINSYLINVYIPCSMLIILNWLTLWLHHQGTAGFARVVLSTIILLTMTNQISNLNKTLPLVSYTRAIDVWTGVCLTFIFLSVTEFIIVHYLGQTQVPNTTIENEINTQPIKNTNQNTVSGKIDFITRIVYPLLFIAFIIIYLSVYAL